MPKQERIQRGRIERGLAEQALAGRELSARGLSERGPAEAVATAGRTGRNDCEAGQGLAEYAILLMTLSVVMVTILTSIGGTVATLYTRISGAFPVL